MLYSPINGWCFVHVPKNGGTSIVKHNRNNQICQFIKVAGGSTYHNKWSYYKNNERLKGLTPVAILRNPWSRCLSIFLYNIKLTESKLGSEGCEWADIDHARLLRDGFKKSWMPGGFFRDEHGREFEYIEGGRQ